MRIICAATYRRVFDVRLDKTLFVFGEPSACLEWMPLLPFADGHEGRPECQDGDFALLGGSKFVIHGPQLGVEVAGALVEAEAL